MVGKDKRAAEQWRASRSPVLNGIAFPSGEICEIFFEWDSEAISYLIVDKLFANLSVFQAEGVLQWVTIHKFLVAEDEGLDLRAYSGGGPLGEDGFVGVEDAKSAELKWLAFFELSNPFKAISFGDGVVEAVSTFDVMWTFPIEKPYEVTVRSLTEEEALAYPQDPGSPW